MFTTSERCAVFTRFYCFSKILYIKKNKQNKNRNKKLNVVMLSVYIVRRCQT